MIKSKQDYEFYLEADKRASRRITKKPWWYGFFDKRMKFQKLLRKIEYYTNCKKTLHAKAYRMFLILRYKRMQEKLGFHIPINTIGPGLYITHTGPIIIAGQANIGSNLRINIGVVIGYNRSVTEAPNIGDNVVIEPGAKIFGGIEIPDWTHIGANAVVNKSFSERGIIIAGVPAKKIKNNPCYPGNVRTK